MTRPAEYKWADVASYQDVVLEGKEIGSYFGVSATGWAKKVFTDAIEPLDSRNKGLLRTFSAFQSRLLNSGYSIDLGEQ